MCCEILFVQKCGSAVFYDMIKMNVELMHNSIDKVSDERQAVNHIYYTQFIIDRSYLIQFCQNILVDFRAQKQILILIKI
jgi:hypothetical protein